MLEFNNNHIFTGYIKELLASINLPKYEMYTAEMAEFKRINGYEHPGVLKTFIYITVKEKQGDNEEKTVYNYINAYFPYYKSGKIQWYLADPLNPDNATWVDSLEQYVPTQYKTIYNQAYYLNKKDLNSTKRYIIKDNIYNSKTHTYLGEYLRFKRDRESIDLMPLYNCFSNEICLNANFNFSLRRLKPGATGEQESDYNTHTVSLSTNTAGYKMYMLPIKLDKEYTIAIDSACGAELICGFYNKYQLVDSCLDSFYNLTYKKYNNLTFNSPVIYNKLATTKLTTGEYKNTAIELLQDICKSSNKSYNYLALLSCLKLFIKIPADCTSSITVLEGNYLNYNDIQWTTMQYKANPVLEITTDETALLKAYVPRLINNSTYLYNKLTLQENDKLTILDQGTIIYTHSVEGNEASTAAAGNDRMITLTKLADNNWTVNITSVSETAEIYAGSSTTYKTAIIKRVQNHAITNYDIFNHESPLYTAGDTQLHVNTHKFKSITPLQLLEINTNKQHPFSDRLIEYLLENTITSSETEIADNIIRVQAAIRPNCKHNENIGQRGIWVEKLRRILYDYMQVPHKNAPGGLPYSATRDCLGYVDRDVEHYYTAWQYDANNNELNAIATISNIDIYSTED